MAEENEIAQEEILDNADDDISVNERFAMIYDRLLPLNYSNTQEIKNLEKELYDLLRSNTENVVGLIIMMQVQIMLGNRAKAKAIAYKIWEKGGELVPAGEFMYINNLINLGLPEMASVMLKPKFEHISSEIYIFYPVMLKFSIMTGNLNLMEKVLANADSKIDKRSIEDFVLTYKELEYAENFKNIQRLVVEESKEELCSYETLFFTDRDFTDIEILLYTGGDAYTRYNLKQKIDNKIKAYFASINTEKLNNMLITVHDINEHWSLEHEEKK